MTIVVNGSGTITGISQGGLNDNIITKNEMATGGAWAPAGTVLQVVQATDATQRSTSSTSFVTASNTLSVTITPTASSSKFLITASFCSDKGSNYGFATIGRNGTDVASSFGIYGLCILNVSSAQSTMQFLDTPNTWAPVTYQVYFRANSGTVSINNQPYPSTITVMEIAA